MPDPKHTCPECLRTFSFPEKMSGKTVDCPACKRPIVLPRARVAEVRHEPAKPLPPVKSKESKSSGLSPLVIGAAGISLLVIITIVVAWVAVGSASTNATSEYLHSIEHENGKQKELFRAIRELQEYNRVFVEKFEAIDATKHIGQKLDIAQQVLENKAELRSHTKTLAESMLTVATLERKIDGGDIPTAKERKIELLITEADLEDVEERLRIHTSVVEVADIVFKAGGMSVAEYQSTTRSEKQSIRELQSRLPQLENAMNLARSFVEE